MAEARSKLEKLTFLLGDWRGNGEMRFGDRPVQFEQRRRSRMTPDGSRIEIVVFTDNPLTEEMFNGEHSFIFVDSSSGELRLRRQWFIDSGFAENTEAVKVDEDGNSVNFKTIADQKGGPGHQLTIRRIKDTELVMEGEVTAGEKRLPYKARLFRRVAKG